MSELDALPAILLVAGSAHTAKSIRRLLSDQFTILHAAEPSEAWEMLQNQSAIIAIVCELGKSIDDFALLERLRQAQSNPLASLPVLLLVGESDDAQRRDLAFSVGATDFINMPFSALELTTRVRLHAQLYRLHSQDNEYEISAQNSSIDLLNTLMQEQHFNSRLEQEISFSLRHKSYISVCLLKIDMYDELSDQYGREALSGIIRALGSIVEKQIRREDTYAYLGDSTFALLYPVTNGLGANIATQRLLEQVSTATLKHEDLELTLTMSAGLYSAMPDDRMTVQDVMQTVRQRVDKAQQLGGAQVVSSKTEQEQTELSVEQALNMISYGRSEGLGKQVPQLLAQILPLLKFANQHNESELRDILGSLESSDQ